MFLFPFLNLMLLAQSTTRCNIDGANETFKSRWNFYGLWKSAPANCCQTGKLRKVVYQSHQGLQCQTDISSNWLVRNSSTIALIKANTLYV